jgi:hypothetical protein
VATPDKSAAERKNIEALCAAQGMRMTEQRRVIARVLASSDDHPDVEELYRRCAKVDDRISISTVYRTVPIKAERNGSTRLPSLDVPSANSTTGMPASSRFTISAMASPV